MELKIDRTFVTLLLANLSSCYLFSRHYTVEMFAIWRAEPERSHSWHQITEDFFCAGAEGQRPGRKSVSHTIFLCDYNLRLQVKGCGIKFPVVVPIKQGKYAHLVMSEIGLESTYKLNTVP